MINLHQVIQVMSKIEHDDIKQAVERLHNCKAYYIENVTVIEKFGSETVWSGVVRVFKIEGNPKADKCYAWSSPIEGSKKRRYYAVLKVPPVDSPEKAVRAAIIQDSKLGKIK